MSYQQELRKALAALAVEHGFPATFEVTVARPGSFEMKVVRLGPPPNPEQIFDLGNGFTPRVQRLVAAWFVTMLPMKTEEAATPAA